MNRSNLLPLLDLRCRRDRRDRRDRCTRSTATCYLRDRTQASATAGSTRNSSRRRRGGPRSRSRSLFKDLGPVAARPLADRERRADDPPAVRGDDRAVGDRHLTPSEAPDDRRDRRPGRRLRCRPASATTGGRRSTRRSSAWWAPPSRRSGSSGGPSARPGSRRCSVAAPRGVRADGPGRPGRPDDWPRRSSRSPTSSPGRSPASSPTATSSRTWGSPPS